MDIKDFPHGAQVKATVNGRVHRKESGVYLALSENGFLACIYDESASYPELWQNATFELLELPKPPEPTKTWAIILARRFFDEKPQAWRKMPQHNAVANPDRWCSKNGSLAAYRDFVYVDPEILFEGLDPKHGG